MDKIKPYWKAVLGFVGPAAGVLIYALLETSPGGSEIVKEEWLLAILTAIGTSAGVYRVPNRDPQALHQQESVQPPNQGGQVDLVVIYYVLGIVFFVVATLWLLGVGTRGVFG